MAKHNQVKAETPKGSLTYTEHTMDAPLLPVVDMERLHQFRPDLVDFVITQSQAEAEFRRNETIRANDHVKTTDKYVFIERMFGKLCALLIGLSGVIGGIFAGFYVNAWLGGTISTATIGTLAVAYLRNSRN